MVFLTELPAHSYASYTALQQEKEALDDLSMELELADEEVPVMYAPTGLHATVLQPASPLLGTA